MNRAVSTILILLLLVSQSLFSAPHSHAGTSVVEPDGHSSRPHVHLNGSENHHEDDDSPSSPSEHSPDHDSDAVYAGDIQLRNDGQVVEVAQAELSGLCSICDDSMTSAVSRLCTRHHSPPRLRSKCAPYLQLLSIRC